MLELKTYQKKAQAALERFLTLARADPSPEGLDRAFAAETGIAGAYRPRTLEGIPYVCLRIPTGGGKTLLAAHLIDTARRAYLEQDYPLTLWLVPTNVIREQTLEALQKPGHPYRAALERHFQDRFAVLDIDHVEHIRAQDIGHTALIVIATMATLRVKETAERTIYAYRECFEPHFAGVPQDTPGLERVTAADLQRIRT